MKQLNLICCCITVMMASGCLAQYPQAMVTLRVINQDGVPVTDTEITASFEDGKEDIRKWPDKNGLVTFSSPVSGSVVFSNVVYKTIRNPNGFNRYYNNTFRYMYLHPSKNVKEGKWQPWNPTLTMVLNERINPIPMYANWKCGITPIPIRNEWIGLDMTKNEWLPPYGNGVHADVEIIHEWDGKVAAEYTGSTLRIRFPDKDAGYYAFHYEVRKMYDTVRFKSPYHALPNETYQKEMIFSEKFDPQTKKWERHLFPDGTGYIFRTRTRFDNDGQLVGAHYGKIYQPAPPIFTFWFGTSRIHLPFYLNPTENDTNIEFDPKQNLLKNVLGTIEP